MPKVKVAGNKRKHEPVMPGTIWTCTIGESHNVPPGGDAPLREAVFNAYFATTGEWPEFIFSGWDGELTDSEREIVDEDRRRLNAA